MSLFILPDGIVNDIEKMLNSFWWGGGNNPNCIKWMAWDRLTGTKNEGGLAFRDLKAFNMAMVAKRGWNLLTMPQSLSSRIFKARWSIGDGSNISVMGSPWLRGRKEGRVNGPQRQCIYAAEDILQVPLVAEVQEDKWNWKEEENGCYSVRSGYRLWRKDHERSGSRGVEGDWCSLWNVKAPPRAKHLLWRICRLSHIIDPRLQIFHDVKSLILDICSKEDSMTAGRVAVMIEILWRNRNNMVWNNEKDDYSKLGLNALCSLQEWFQAQKHGTNVGNRTTNMRWMPPVEGSTKCNVDAGYNNRRGTTNRGWCMRDHMGSFMCAGAAWDFGHYPILEAEALALKEAIQSAINMEVQNVIFESDSQRTVQAIHSNHQGVSEFSCIISSINGLLFNFPNFEVKFVKRQANTVAHTIAKAADSWSRRSLFHMIPLCIEQLLLLDMN
ncbi:uncharacterized protein LOC131657726 [Vicia villosa]|uniref:uncharacterized protein LOC131657726 n=1 Tax=Vicia villosa TaxID=3911 RepID=UPI00273C18A2|nr:uncharacterized protein LOC131657726 [Vicia villosa]